MRVRCIESDEMARKVKAYPRADVPAKAIG
jgi:hypothetical protein